MMFAGVSFFSEKESPSRTHPKKTGWDRYGLPFNLQFLPVYFDIVAARAFRLME